MDTVSRRNGGTLQLDLYRKPSHTAQYLSFESNPPLSNKSAVSSLVHGAHKVPSEQRLRKEEIARIEKQLEINGYPRSFIKRAANDVERRISSKNRKVEDQSNTDEPDDDPDEPDSDADKRKTTTAYIPFVDGTSQTIARILSKLDIRTVQLPRSWKWTIQDATDPSLKSGVVYELTCNDCDLTYVGETARNLGKRVSEHRAGVCNDHP